MSDRDENLLDHDYDGIRELDNRLPEWWLFLFFATIIFSFVYYLHYEVAGGPDSDQELATSMARIQSLKKAGPSFTEEKLAALFTDEGVKQGHEVFAAKCAMCHGPDGGGLIGPNLTDNHWLHGKGTRLDVAKVIGEGVVSKGMPAWAEQISEGELVAVAAYVYSLKGRNVPGGKPPQGEEAP